MPSSARRCAGRLARSSPANSTRPLLQGSMPITVRSSVVLPAPLRPTRATVSPASTLAVTPRSTEMPAMLTVTLSNSSMSASDHVANHFGIRQDLLRRPVGGDPPGDPCGQSRGIPTHDVDVVLDEDAGDPSFGQGAHQGVHDLVLFLARHPARGLVHDQQP